MDENKKSGKKWIVYIGIAAMFFACIGLYLLWSVKDYIDKVPDITPKTSVAEHMDAENIIVVTNN